MILRGLAERSPRSEETGLIGDKGLDVEAAGLAGIEGPPFPGDLPVFSRESLGECFPSTGLGAGPPDR